MKFRPLGDKILVKREEAASKTESGIFLPESSKEKPKQGKIVALGDGHRPDNRWSTPAWLELHASRRADRGAEHAGAHAKAEHAQRDVSAETPTEREESSEERHSRKHHGEGAAR